MDLDLIDVFELRVSANIVELVLDADPSVVIKLVSEANVVGWLQLQVADSSKRVHHSLFSKVVCNHPWRVRAHVYHIYPIFCQHHEVFCSIN